MKRRMISFITTLALCLNLCPVWAFAADGQQGDLPSDGYYVLEHDFGYDKPYEILGSLMFDTAGYTFTGTGSSAILVTETGKLYLKGTVKAPKGVGVEVRSGGSLSITDPETFVYSGTDFALDIASGANVQLSAGRYVGRDGAIQTAGDNLAALLEPGCAYFDENGNLLSPEDAVWAWTLVVGLCPGHPGKTYTHTSGTTTHSWTCPYCNTEETEACTFTFDQDGNGTCDSCGNTITIAVDETGLSNLTYDGTLKPGTPPPTTVTLTDGSNKELEKDTDYEVDYKPRADAGEITVTVTGITFNGTFTKTYHVKQDEPGIKWDETTKDVNYTGSPANLPSITITIRASEDLHQYLQYAYRTANTETEFTPGLPTNAGTYEIKAYLPESQNYTAAETNPNLTLTINKIPAVSTGPAAKTLTYNREAQELVTAGVLKPGAAAEGAKIEFKLGTDGAYSTDIPTGIGVSSYNVYYRVAETENYTGVSETLVKNPDTKYPSARINHREITPTIELEYSKTMYTGEIKEPKFTVKDGDYEIPASEYTFEYSNNRNVGTATVTVSNADKGNYKIITATATFQITNQPQAALTITQKPNSVIYGDTFTLGTSGGSGSGDVTWAITAGSDVAAVDEHSGQVTVTGHGSVTVQATKSGKDPTTGKTNYDDATASWTFNAGLRPVTATVTAEDKSYGETYDGTDLKEAKVHAVVEQGVLPGDEITITGLTGTFSDENAGMNKTVTVDKSGASITGNNSQHYAVSYSSAPVTATIHKAVVHITTAPDAKTLTYSGEAQGLIDASVLVVDTEGVQVEYALSEDGQYSTAIPNGINAGAYTVWYRVRETDNYTGLAPARVDVTINKKPVAPKITLGGDGLKDEGGGPFYIYDGNAKEPVVTLYEADGTTLIPAGEYTVSYGNNVNVGTAATVTVTAKADGNYEFTPNPVTATFEIKKEQARVLTAPEAAGDPLTFNNRAQKLVTAGTGYGGKMVYSLDKEDEDSYSETIPTETDAKDYTVYYKVAGDGNHSDSGVGHVTVTIAPKPVTPTIDLLDGDGNPLVSYTYDGSAKEPTVIVKDGSTVIAENEYNIIYRNNTDAGEATVSITDKPGGNYTVTGSATFVIQKADIVFNPAPSAADITYDGQPHELLVSGTTSGGEVLYALNSPTSTYTAAIPEGTRAGNYVVYYKVIGDKNHNDLTDLTTQKVEVTIQRKPLTAVTIELSPEGFAYDGAVKLPAVTVKDGNTVLPEEEYTWSCDVDAPTNVGTYTITISDKDGGNYDLSKLVPPANQATFTIGQVPQEALVIGGKPAAVNYGDSFQLTVTGGSGDGEVTWRAEGPATVDNDGNVTITGVGEVTIAVEKAADTNYLAAEAQWTFTAAPRPVNADITVANRDYDGTTDATVTSAGITTINDDTVTIDSDSIIAVFDTPAAGTGKTVTLDTSDVKVTGDDVTKYAITYPATTTANITQATTTITADPAKIDPLTYSGQPQALVTAGETNVGFIVYSLDGTSFSPEIPTGTNAGDYTVYYKVNGTADYTGVAVNEDPVTVTIAPKPITPVIELSESSYLYDGTKKDPKITVKDGKTVIEPEQYTVIWAGTKNQTDAEMLTVADTYTATIKSVSNGNYTFVDGESNPHDATAQVKIVAAEQAALSITGKPDHVCYGDKVTTLGTTGGSGNGTVTWSITAGGANSTIDPATGELTVKNTGSITVKAERTVPNYAAVSDTWTFTVEPKPVTAEVTVADKVYDGNNTATVTSAVVNDLVDSGNDTVSITGLTAEFDNANAGTNKTVTLDRSAPGFGITCDTNKYAVSIPDTAKANITPRQVTVAVTLSDHDLKTDDDGKYYYTYDGAEKKPAVTVTGSDETGYSKELTASDYTVNYAKNKNFGIADVTVTASADGNYTFDPAKVNFEIRKGAAVLTGSPQAKDLTYTGKAQELVTVGTAAGGTVVYSPTGAAGSYSETIPAETGAGTYTVYYMVKGDTNHEDTAPGQVSVTIRPREITSKITLNPTSYEYDGTAKEPAVTVEGGVNTGTDLDPIAASEYIVSYRDNTNAGTATVTVSDANGGNYIVNGTVTFEITKKAPVVTPPEGKTGLQYNGALQELVKAGVSDDGTVVYSVNGGNYSAAIPTAAAVGDYEIKYKVLGDGNHSDTDPATLGTVTIAKNTVNNPAISLSSEQFTFNGSQQKPTVTVYDDSGLLIPGHEYTATITGPDSNIVNVGTYTVTVTTSNSSNYVIATNNTRTFEIVPANQETISITGTQAQVRYGDAIQLGITGGTGSGTVTWTVTGNSTISATGLLTVKDVGGPIKVTAERSAGDNYTKVSATWEFSAAKKQVTAVVTAEDRPYAANDTSVTVTAEVPSSELVPGDSIKIEGVTGTFADPNVGTNKKVTVDSRNASASAGSINADRYEITYPATTTASIFKADVDTTKVTAPTAKTDLEYTGIAQALIEAGSSPEGTLEYSTDGLTYSASLPTGTDAKGYDVWYRVKGDSNHNDTAGTKLEQSATIAPQEVTDPTIELKPAEVSYDGAAHKPDVTVKDKNGRVIPNSEYMSVYGEGNWMDVGTYKVTITDAKENGNYNITKKEAEFKILMMGQNPLTITNQPSRAIYYGDTFTLSAVGGSGTGTIKWEIAGPAEINQSGTVKVTGSGSVTITATKQADSNYGATIATWTFSAEKKPVKAIVTAKNKVYDTNDTAQLEISWKDGDLLNGDTITLNLTGRFDTPDVGTNKTVTITGDVPTSDKYAITWNGTTTASITPGATAVTAPGVLSLTYTGQPQDLVSRGTATNGTIYYSLDGAVYTLNPPQGTNAGSYTVWYKVTGNKNYEDVAPQALPVTISPKTVTSPVIELSPEVFDYDGTAKKPDVVVKDGSNVIPAGEYTVGYSNNVQAGTDAKVTISDVPGGNYTVSGSTTFTIRAGVASLKDEPKANNLTYNGFAQELLTPGTAVNGRVVYSTSKTGNYTTSIPEETNAGTYQVWYKVEGENGAEVNEADATPRSKPVTIQPKQVTPIILVNGGYNYSTPYTGSPVTPPLTVIVEGKALTSGVDYYPAYSNNDKPGTATVTVQNLSGNYQFFAVATFEITKSKATFSMEPEAKTGLVYTGEPQELVELGMGQDGAAVVYSLNGGTFYPFVPTATEVGSYVVSAKVQGNDFYADSDVKSYRVTIGRNTIAEDKLGVTLSADSLAYTGSELKPTVTVRDGEGNIISASEYAVTYANNINVGQADVTVTSTTKNYSFSKTVHFTIREGDAPALTITGKKDTVYYGDTLQLGTTGGSGAVTWSVEKGNENAESQGNGRFKIKGSGSITVKAETSDSSDTWTFYADPKPVTATVIAADKTFDNSTAVNSWTVIVNDRVNGDIINSDDIAVTGQFASADVGTQTVYITGFTPSDAINAKYKISCPATTTATITPAPASVTNAPQKVTQPLTYNGSAQPLVTKGTASDGKMMYSLDGINYSYDLPTGTDAKTYTVWYKAVATDKNHEDSVPDTVTDITISPNTDTPKVICTPDSFQFDGTAKAPTTIVLWDNNNHTIPESEYTVTVPSVSAVGEHKVTVTDKPGGNYEFSSTTGGTFTIETGSQSSLTIVTELYDVYYGDSFRLSATGGSGDGAIVWSIPESDKDVARISGNGVVTVTGTGGFTVEAYREAKDGYKQSNTVSLPFEAHPKPVTPTVTADDKPYDSKTDATLHATWKTGDLVNSDTIMLTVTGEFATADAGTNKRVNIQTHEATGEAVSKYTIIWPDSTTASIYKVDAKIENAPQPNPGTDNKGLTFTGEAQPLVTGGTTEGNIGTIVYSTGQNGAYSTSIPTGTNAGTYTVWYKVADSVNYTGIPAAAVEVEIAKATPSVGTAPTASGTAGQSLSEISFGNGGAASVEGKFVWKDGNAKLEAGKSLYEAIFKPDDAANYNEVAVEVQVTVSSSNPGGEAEGPNYTPANRPDTPAAAPTQTTVQNGTASTVVSAADGGRLVQSAKASQSRNVVIKPEITGDVTKTEVSIPSSTASRLSSETDAALTVSSPVADVTISNEALGTLGRAGGTVSVATEQVDQSVVVTLAAGGETVEQVPGGLTLTVPAEDAGPGTVAVLVHDDGTRETIRKSVVEDGVVSIPLSGSATVEIVDNSKDFADIPPESWAADAVDFASAHELLSGTGEATFSPDLAMSRGMLATVLYRLEGNPELDLTDAFSDVNSDAWYAEGVTWAVENGIAGGYGGGQFGPDDDITREQFVVMLWRYAGSPAAGSQALDFTDADQVSSYAQEALCWAVENGILRGKGGGVLDPRGTATRAQAAQLLKNFMENT